jgi:hypothetical protein
MYQNVQLNNMLTFYRLTFIDLNYFWPSFDFSDGGWATYTKMKQTNKNQATTAVPGVIYSATLLEVRLRSTS